MRLFTTRTPVSTISKLFISAIGIITISLTPLLSMRPVSALTINSSRDCDSNAVINCGALTVNGLQSAYNNQKNVRVIYSHFGITSSDIAGMDNNAVEGRVTSGGRVLVNGTEVAKDAITAGMQNMAGSTKQNVGGVTFFMRPPSASFQQSSLPAFVVMKSGQFQFAVIASCGNPVKATPVVKKQAQAVTPAQTPKKAVVTPPPAVTQSQTQEQSVEVTPPPTVVTTTPPPAPVVVTPAPQPQATVLPNTGVGDVLGLGSFISLAVGGAHYAFKRKLLGF